MCLGSSQDQTRWIMIIYNRYWSNMSIIMVSEQVRWRSNWPAILEEMSKYPEYTGGETRSTVVGGSVTQSVSQSGANSLTTLPCFQMYLQVSRMTSKYEPLSCLHLLGTAQLLPIIHCWGTFLFRKKVAPNFPINAAPYIKQYPEVKPLPHC